MNGVIPLTADLAQLHSAEGEDAVLAFKHRPLFLLDNAEPFLPLAAGFTVYRGETQSVSSRFQICPVGECVIEYAIWYDWDIQHLYDLEHVWVHLDEAGSVLQVEASRHGSRLVMQRPDGSLPVEQGRPVLYLEPGKHAHWADGEDMRANSGEVLSRMCGPLAGEQGVHLSNRFSDAGLITASAHEVQLARLQLQQWQFQPSWKFDRTSDDAGSCSLTLWSLLEVWIPTRVAKLLAQLHAAVPRLERLA